MGVRYHNIVLQGVTQQELADYLAQFSFDCYISPPFNEYTALYEMAMYENYSFGLSHIFTTSRQLPKLIKKAGQLDRLMRQYEEPYLAALVCLTSHLSARFSCSALAVRADGDWAFFWYHLSRNGIMLDEYTTRSGSDWRPGRGIKDFSKDLSVDTPKGGDAHKLCSAFGREHCVQDIHTILQKPSDYESFWREEEGEDRYLALLKMDRYDCSLRHEALARALGMRPCWVVGMDYLCCEGSGDFWAVYTDVAEDIDPSEEDALDMVKHLP